MTERLRSASTVGPQSPPPKTENDLSPRKTMIVLVIVVGCFAVLWPKVFYPMLVGSANEHIKPSSIDKTTGCCDVISETDVNTIKLMSELCGGTIIKDSEEKPLTGKEIVQRCRKEVLDTCGIDISAVLQEQVRLGQSVKQILDEIRSLNGSLCLKYNYGVAPWRLGVPHTIKTTSDSPNIRQERPMHLRSELVHPAFRERGRAIPQPQQPVPTRPPPRVVEGRPGPLPGMRPTLGGAGHVVPPSKQGTSSMSIIMPIYTIGIVIFFSYTLVKIIFKKQPQSVGGSLYPPVDPDQHFRKEVFESESIRLQPRLSRENIASKLVVNAMSALLDEVDQEIEARARRKSSEVASQDLVNGTLSNGDAVKPQDEDQPSVKVLGMETTASCEGGKKWSRPESPVVPTPSPPPPVEPVSPPQEIYLEGALPPQSQLLVSESAIEPEPTTGEDPAVVLSGKMTLSVISPDSENVTEEATEPGESLELDKDIQEFLNKLRSENKEETEEIEVQLEEAKPSSGIEKDIEEFLQKLKNEPIEEPVIELEEVTPSSSGLEQDIEKFLEKLRKDQSEIQAPLIRLESEDAPSTTVEVESLEKEVDDLIKEAIESIQQREFEVVNEINKETVALNEQEPATSQNLESKVQLKEEISNEIEKLIQEVKDMPVIEQKKKEVETEVTNPIEQRPEEKVEEIIEKIVEQRIEVELIPENKLTEVLDEQNSVLEVPNEDEVGNHKTEEIEISKNMTKDEVKSELTSERPIEDDTPTLETVKLNETERETEIIEKIANNEEKTEKPTEEITVIETQKLDEKLEIPANDVAIDEIKTEEPVVEEVQTQKLDETEQETEILDKIAEKNEEKPEKPTEEITLIETQKLDDKLEIPENDVAIDQIKTEEPVVEEVQTQKLDETKQETEILEKIAGNNEEKTEKPTKEITVVETQKLDEKLEIPESDVAIDQIKTEEPVVEEVQTQKLETEILEKIAGNNEVALEKPAEEVVQTQKLDETKLPDEESLEKRSSKSEVDTNISDDDEELASDEELVEEIEEIVYEEESCEEEEIEVEEVEEEESEEEIPNITESSAQRINGERSEDLVEESKYTTVSGATAAENDISDEELIENEEVSEEEEEVIEIEEVEDEILDVEGNDLNHLSGDSDVEL